ncbi:hypothetical protein Aab01nite_62940 [Paractinoplanes abujensis]|uniref:Uncharacterized protein n=1 Tax=Paractinoplanes abujensis TaxID=882441 RepID=A0A7W7G1K0_9ACTN|nr:DUF6461 domain-containing protein [Actinoplanes abujensis]MBB4692797.1 hypothetical protein [Actinoplanes abujensis]GID22704.1 hypothetical protein Aab01nite_62940 [Actinoplanes abujensis]
MTTTELLAALPLLTARIPAAPARRLGRLGAPEEADPHGPARDWDGSEPATVLRALGPLPVERLLGALELTVGAHNWDGWPDLLAGLPAAPAFTRYGFLSFGTESDTTSAVALLERLRPGLAGVVLARVRELATQPQIAGMLTASPEVTDEPGIAAAHGAAHLGLAVAVAAAALHQADPPVVVDRVAAAIGLGIAAAASLLRGTPMPAAYAPALRARIRAEYLLPSHSSRRVTVTGHRFGLTEHELPKTAGFGANGLVAVVDGGVVIRTGADHGSIPVDLLVLAEPPAEVDAGWEEIVEVSWHAAEGRAVLSPPDGSRRVASTPPWPGDYRLRVHARGRDEQDAEFEAYRLVVWAAPAAPQTVLQRTDRLGHRLRGEPEPVRAPKPEHAYRWIGRTPLTVAATVTVGTGTTAAEALRAFRAGGDPAPIDQLRPTGPWAMVLDLGGAVLIVEENGFEGSRADVLQALSTGGRAASMFWNVNANTRLSFAAAGEMLSSFEPYTPLIGEVPPEVAPALDGLDLGGPGGRTEMGLVAVERFTGHALTEADLTRLYDAGVGYPLTRP